MIIITAFTFNRSQRQALAATIREQLKIPEAQAKTMLAIPDQDPRGPHLLTALSLCLFSNCSQRQALAATIREQLKIPEAQAKTMLAVMPLLVTTSSSEWEA